MSDKSRIPITQRPKWVALGLLLLVGVANHFLLLFLLDQTYWDWYLENGKFIGLVTTFLALVWPNFDKNSAWISANPSTFIAARYLLVGTLLFSLGTAIRGAAEKPADQTGCFSMLLSFGGFLFSIAFLLLLMVILALGLLLAAPLQYLIYLVLGAPVRAHVKVPRVTIVSDPKLGPVEIRDVARDEAVPEGWWQADLFEKPVKILGGIEGLTFWLLEQVLT